MTPSNQIPAVCNYGTSAVYSNYPSPEQMRAGVVPLDSLPAAWWNKMWCASNCAINEARDMVGQIITEVNNVLCQAGINPQAACTDQLYQSINKIRQTLATASVPGAVVSSSVASEVAVDPTTGRMTVNCLGNAASLSTSASTVVGAINELKSTYDCCFSDTATAIGGKAPTSHASSATTYGVGSADNYGHLKISDTYTSVLAACSGVAASQMALACVYAVAAAAAAGNVSLGNTAGCALGTAAAGTAITAARSDHVHPKPSRSDLGLGTAADYNKRAGASAVTYVEYSGANGCCLLAGDFLAYWNGAYNSTGSSNLKYTSVGALGTAAACAASAFRSCTWTPASVVCACCPYKASYTSSVNYGIALWDTTAGVGYRAMGVGGGTNVFAYNPSTGTVLACCFKGCASDSASLGGKAAACYLKTTGCAADSAKVGGYTWTGVVNCSVTCVEKCNWSVHFSSLCSKLISQGCGSITLQIANGAVCISACCAGKYLACILAGYGYTKAATSIGSTVINPNYSNAMTLYWVGMSDCSTRQALTTLANCRLRRCVGDGYDMPFAPYAAGMLSFSVE